MLVNICFLEGEIKWCVRHGAIFSLCLLFLLTPMVSLAAQRVALVIGNSAYDNSPLKNPVNDADDMALALQRQGFEVIKKTDANREEMLRALTLFSKKLKKADVGLFYFAGHGMQIDGVNHLLPVGAKVSEESDVEFESVKADRVVAKMRDADNKLNMVVLDACRDNPFKRSFRSSQQGLARMDAPKGTIIAYATGPGSVAADGSGRNGVFTKHLLKAMTRPELDIQDVFNEAGMGVMAETFDRQIPWTSNTPIPRYFLAGGVAEHKEAQSQKVSGAKDDAAKVKRGVVDITGTTMARSILTSVMDENDRQQLQNVFELSVSWKVHSWDSNVASNRYAVTPQPVFYQQKVPCRKMVIEISTADNQDKKQMKITACRDNSGYWKVER